MKAKPVKQIGNKQVDCKPEEATHLWLHFPTKYMSYRMVTVNNEGTWKWNLDTENPTISPSILSKSGDQVCHSFVKDGKVEFLNDCTHEFAGKVIDLLEVDI